jgi:hypothetical protein
LRAKKTEETWTEEEKAKKTEETALRSGVRAKAAHKDAGPPAETPKAPLTCFGEQRRLSDPF